MTVPDVSCRDRDFRQIRIKISEQKRKAQFLRTLYGYILRGIVMGLANVIPGVSGGPMAVSMGIYDKLIGAGAGLFKHFKQSMKLLIPLVIGMVIGIVGFGFLLEYLLANYALAACLTFVGLILGGLPILWLSLRRNLKKTSRHIGASEVACLVGAAGHRHRAAASAGL